MSHLALLDGDGGVLGVGLELVVDRARGADLEALGHFLGPGRHVGGCGCRRFRAFEAGIYYQSLPPQQLFRGGNGPDG